MRFFSSINQLLVDALGLSFGLLFALGISALLLLLLAATVYFRSVAVTQPASSGPSRRKLVVGFFHPYCNSGGGGERVLWRCIHALHALSPDIQCVVYTGDRDATPQQIAQKAAERFHLPAFTRPVTFIYLTNRRLLSAELYPHLTMLLQSLASLPVAFSALRRYKPHVWIDSTGFAFTLPLARIVFGCATATYTHYPTISRDMLQLVYDRRPAYNNSARYVGAVGRAVKLVYYLCFAALYALAGRCASLVLVNSSWTYGHIAGLWGNSHRIHIVYPPCDTSTLQQLPMLKVRTLADVAAGVGAGGVSDGYREDVIISVGQFRPEKDHALQLRAFALFRGRMKTAGKLQLVEHVRLVLIGGVRDSGDQQRVEALRTLASSLGIESHVSFLLNEPFSVLQSQLASALLGLHSMWNEHFGMGVVELAAAGLLVLAHNSGGPRDDILVETRDDAGRGRCGLLASSAEEYADALVRVFGSEWKGSEQMEAMRRRGRQWCSGQFSDEQFERRFNAAIQPLLDNAMQAARVAQIPDKRK